MPITLEKKGDFYKIDLSKHIAVQELTIKVNLNWNQTNSGVFFDSSLGNKESALEFGCMYETVYGHQGDIHSLGTNFGSKDNPPYIFLDKGDLTRKSQDEKNMIVYRPDLIKRVLFFALFYQEKKDFQSLNGWMTFDILHDESVQIKLNNPERDLHFCAAAMINNLGSELRIIKEEKYFQYPQSADKHYRFGLQGKYS